MRRSSGPVHFLLLLIFLKGRLENLWISMSTCGLQSWQVLCVLWVKKCKIKPWKMCRILWRIKMNSPHSSSHGWLHIQLSLTSYRYRSHKTALLWLLSIGETVDSLKLLQHELPPQIFTGDPRTCTIFISAKGSNWGSWGFPVIKVTAMHQVRMTPASTAIWAWIIWNMRKTLHCALRSWTHWFCVRGRQQPEDPQFEPHGWQCITQGWYTRSGNSCVYLWLPRKTVAV